MQTRYAKQSIIKLETKQLLISMKYDDVSLLINNNNNNNVLDHWLQWKTFGENRRIRYFSTTNAR